MNINKISKIAKLMCILLSAASIVGTGDILVRRNHLYVYLGNGSNPAKNYGWGRIYRYVGKEK